MAGGSQGAHGQSHAGVSFHPPKRWQVRSGQAMCAIMWYHIFSSLSLSSHLISSRYHVMCYLLSSVCCEMWYIMMYGIL